MHMAQLKAWTIDDLYRLPDDGNRYEVLHGELYVTPPPSSDHATVIARLNRILMPFVDRHGLGLIFMNHPVIQAGESHVEPDLIVRQPPAPKSKWKDAPIPILVVEVLSPGTWRRDVGPKRDFYVNEVRVPDYWIIDEERRQVTLARPDTRDRVITDRFEWSPAGTNASLAINLDDLFVPIVTS